MLHLQPLVTESFRYTWGEFLGGKHSDDDIPIVFSGFFRDGFVRNALWVECVCRNQPSSMPIIHSRWGPSAARFSRCSQQTKTLKLLICFQVFGGWLGGRF